MKPAAADNFSGEFCLGALQPGMAQRLGHTLRPAPERGAKYMGAPIDRQPQIRPLVNF